MHANSYLPADSSEEESKGLLSESEDSENKNKDLHVEEGKDDLEFGIEMTDDLDREEFLKKDIAERLQRLENLKKKIENEYVEQERLISDLETDYEDPTSLSNTIQRRIDFIKKYPFWVFLGIGIIILFILILIRFFNHGYE